MKMGTADFLISLRRASVASMLAAAGLSMGGEARAADFYAGKNIDLLIGGTVAGSGEIVIIEENFGVRITDFVEEA